VRGTADDVALLATAADDLRSAGRVADLRFEDGAEALTVDVTL
jgi:hypothetical protein